LWKYKILASVSTSYITPSLYQLYSIYGNKDLLPEEAVIYETGVSVYGGDKFIFNVVLFKRDETDPIDFVSLFDDDGNYIGGQYVNLASEREVKGVEISATYELTKNVLISVNYAYNDTDKPESFYRIPKNKLGAVLTLEPLKNGTLSIKYNNTGERTTFDYNSYSEVTLDSYQLVDVYASYKLFKSKFTVYGSVNNLFDEDFIAVLGYTTRGRNYSAGLRLDF
jgi:vitamin B12 transporter